MPRIKQNVQRVLDGVTANGAGVVLDVSNYKAVEVQVRTTGNTTATIKFAFSMSMTKPDFTKSPSYTNPYDFAQLSWLNNDSSFTGANGIVLAGTDIIRIYEVNTNFIRWICPIVSGYSAGTITVETDCANDYTR